MNIDVIVPAKFGYNCTSTLLTNKVCSVKIIFDLWMAKGLGVQRHPNQKVKRHPVKKFIFCLTPIYKKVK
jgi:hypothetical protein